MCKKSLTAILVLCISISVMAQEQSVESHNWLQLNSVYSFSMMEANQNLRKLDILLDAKRSGALQDKSFYLGTSVIGISTFQKSNTDSKFGYLMRHPTANNQVGETVSEAVIHSAQLSFTTSINSWLTAYGEMLYDPEQSFGSGTNTALGRNQVQFRKGIILVGNLDKSPVYLALGKMDTPFGQMGSVSPFTNSTMWHAFGGLGYGAVLGFKKSGFHASFNAIQGGAQFRALHSPVDSTVVPSRVNNFAADLNYTIELGDRSNLRLGGSYLHASAYCQGFPVQHFMPCSENNPAFSFYGKISAGERFVLKGSFASTTEVWPGTFNPNPPLDVFVAAKVTSLDFGAKYVLNPDGEIVYALSGEFSNFKAGPDGAPWERQSQIVLGLSGMVNHSSKLFIEVFRTEGYAPLNWISGGNFPDPGITHSDADANSLGIVVGANLTL